MYIFLSFSRFRERATVLCSFKVLAVKKGAVLVLTYDTVQVEDYNGDPHQLWSTEYLPDDNSVWK